MSNEVIGFLGAHEDGMESSDVSTARLLAQQIGDAVGRIRLIES